MGGNTKKLFNMINGLTKTQEEALAKRFGNKMLNRVKSSVNQENKPQNIPTTKVKSSWIESIAWDANLKVLSLKTLKSPIVYTLPFFPYRVAKAMLVNASPGGTLWDGYWKARKKDKKPDKIKKAAGLAKNSALAKYQNKATKSLKTPKMAKIRRPSISGRPRIKKPKFR